MLTLECPHCQCTHTVREWNDRLKDSILLGRADEVIPEETENWDEYRDLHDGLVDCPSCEEVCCFEDMVSV